MLLTGCGKTFFLGNMQYDIKPTVGFIIEEHYEYFEYEEIQDYFK